MLRGPQRLHLAALGVWALSGVGPIIVLIIAGSLVPIAAVFILVGTLVSSWVRWWRFTWYIDDEALVVQQGLFQRQRRVIPRERIQSVERVRRLRHRLFGVVELRIESIGGASTEGQLDALRPDVAELVRTELLGKTRARGPTTAAPDATAEAAEPPPLVRMTPGQLVLAGVTGGRVGVMAAILGFASQVFAEQIGALFEEAVGFFGAQGWVGVLLAVTAFVVLTFLLSVIATTFAYWGFTLTSADRKLHTRRGLLEQRSGTIPLHRVQSLRVEENLLRRPIGRAAVKVEVAGRAGAEASETSVVLPIGTRAEAFALVERITGRDDISALELTAAPAGARARRYVRAAVATVIVTGALVAWQGLVGLAGVAVAVPATALAASSYRALGRATPPGAVVARAGVMVRTTHVTAERSAQAVAMRSTPFQRRRGLATLELHIARSPGGGDDPALIDITQAEARAELLRLSAIADAAARRPRSIDGRIMRRLEADDASEARELLTAALGEAIADETLAAVRDDAATRAIVVDEDGEVVGFAALAPTEVEAGDDGAAAAVPVLALGPVAVREDRRGEGIGGRLVKRAVSIASALGAHVVVAAGPGEFYARHDFTDPAALGLEVAGTGGEWAPVARRLPADDGSVQGAVRWAGPLARLLPRSAT